MRVRGESAAVATESDGSVAGSRARAASASRKGSRKKAFELKGFAGSPDDVCTDVAYAVDLRADPPTTVSELSKVLGVADREGHRAGRDSPRPRPRPAAPARAEVGDGRLLQAGSDWVANARGKLKAGVEPDVFLALVRREIEVQAVRRRVDETARTGCDSADPGVASRVTAAAPRDRYRASGRTSMMSTGTCTLARFTACRYASASCGCANTSTCSAGNRTSASSSAWAPS